MIVAVLLSLSVAAKATPAEDFTRGVAARENARVACESFARAAAGFDVAWERSPSAAAAGARARAHFLADDLPRALAALHAGLALAPYDADLQGDLRAVRGTIRFPEPADAALRVRPDEMTGLRFRVSPWDAFAVGSVCGLVAVVGSVLTLTSRPRLAAGVAVAGWLGVLACGLLAWRLGTDTPTPVAILTADTVLRRGNAASYPPRMADVLPRGAELHVVAERGGWVQVELPGGAAGWVPAANVLK